MALSKLRKKGKIIFTVLAIVMIFFVFGYKFSYKKDVEKININMMGNDR